MLFLFAFNVPLGEFTCMFWVVILHEYKSLSHKAHPIWDPMMLQYAVMTGLIQCAFHLVQISDFAISNPPTQSITETPPYLRLVLYRELQLFPQLFAAHRLSYLTQRFRNLISQSKRIYSTALLSSCALAHWSFLTLFCFLFCNIGQLHKAFYLEWILTHFSRHWFSCAVIFRVVSMLSGKLMTDDIILCKGKTGCIEQTVIQHNID